MIPHHYKYKLIRLLLELLPYRCYLNFATTSFSFSMSYCFVFSSKSTLLKVMAGRDTEYDGLARPLPGASIGYLAQEPELTQPTVQECIDEAVASSQAILNEYNELSLKLADPDLSDTEMATTMEQLEVIGNKIDAGDLWELDRVVARAMDSLRVPPGNAKIETLSGGEKRRTALCRLLLQNHDMLLLDEPTNHLDTGSIAWLEVSIIRKTPSNRFRMYRPPTPSTSDEFYL